MSARWLVAVTISIFWAAGLFVPPASAEAGGSCSVVLPTRLVVDSPFERFTARLGSDCANSGKGYASWDLYHSRQGWKGIYIFDSGQSTDTWDFYDWDYLGAYSVEPSGAFDTEYNDLYQNTQSTIVRLGSRAALTGTRSGQYVTLRSSATRYTPSAESFRPWVNTPIRLYTRSSTSALWRYFRTVRTNRYGKISTRFAQRYTRYYQARTLDTATIWGRTVSTRR